MAQNTRHIFFIISPSTVVNAMSALLAEVDQQREEDARLRAESRQVIVR